MEIWAKAKILFCCQNSSFFFPFEMWFSELKITFRGVRVSSLFFNPFGHAVHVGIMNVINYGKIENALWTLKIISHKDLVFLCQIKCQPAVSTLFTIQ